MALFDRKLASIYIRDGYSKNGTVNNAGGYPVGTTTMTVKDFVGVVAVGDTFKIAAQTTLYTVTAQTATGGNTTSITFTPALTGAVLNNDPINVQPHKLYVKIGDGNLTFDEKRAMEYIKDRGKLDTVRLADEEPLEVSLQFQWIFLKSVSGDTSPTIKEAFKRTGLAANWVSSAADKCEPYAVDLILEYEPACSTELKEVIILKDFVMKVSNMIIMKLLFQLLVCVISLVQLKVGCHHSNL